MTANTTVLGYIRTYVPYGVGVLLGYLLINTGIDLTGPFAVSLEAVLIAAAINIYYLIVRVAELKVPGLGIFLGVPAKPVYQDVSDLWNSFIRTGIPTVVSAVVVALAGSALHLSAEAQTGLIAIAVGIVSSLYYTAARAVAAKFPNLNFLLVGAPVGYVK